MKYHLLVLLIIGVCIILSQRALLAADSTLYLSSYDWEINETKIDKGYLITRLIGENNSTRCTNIRYESADTLIAKAKLEHELNFDDPQAAEEHITRLSNFAKGGMICLYVKRFSVDWANRKNFTVVVKDDEDKTILYKEKFTESLPEFVPAMSSDYRIMAISFIDVLLPKSFYVYILDTYGSTTRYKFKVRKLFL